MPACLSKGQVLPCISWKLKWRFPATWTGGPSCPEGSEVFATASLHLFAFSELPFPSTHFLKPRMLQTQGTDLLKFRLAFPEENFPSCWKSYFCKNHILFFFLSTRMGEGDEGFFFFSFLVNVLCSVTAIKSSENTISFEKKKLKALLQTKLWKKGGLGGWKGPTMVRRKGFMLMRLMPFVSQASTSSLRAISGCTERLREPQSTPTPPFPAQRRIW